MLSIIVVGALCTVLMIVFIYAWGEGEDINKGWIALPVLATVGFFVLSVAFLMLNHNVKNIKSEAVYRGYAEYQIIPKTYKEYNIVKTNHFHTEWRWK